MNENALRALMEDMSLEEKLGQLNQLPGQLYQENYISTGNTSWLNFKENIVKYAGSVINVYDPETIIKVQKEHIKNHPHHIPMLFMLDVIHGFHTIFPIPLAQACSFDTELVKKIASAAAKESCYAGLHVTFSPMVDISRDGRWGRVMESAGEDTYLSSCMAKAAVEGYQGNDLTEEGTISACVKHFAAYGAVEGGREYGTVDVSERNLRQYYLPSYKAACDAGSGMLMCAFNTISAIPCTGNQQLLHDILRNEWGYAGVVITDYASMTNMQIHGISDEDGVLAKAAMAATVDIEMCVGRYAKALQSLVEKGEIVMEQINAAVWRILSLKNRLGLFENPYRYADPEKAKKCWENTELLQLAEDSVSETSVLLKNEDKFLPLKKTEKIAFIGPYLYERDMLGGWCGVFKHHDETIAEVLSKCYPQCSFSYTEGCKMLGEEQPEISFYGFTDFENDSKVRKHKIMEAAEAARNADKVILLLGEHPRVGGELSSKACIEIPEIQQELFEAITAVNENVAVVLFNHRPLDVHKIVRKAKALLTVWFPGTKAAGGIVNMLFGDRAPSGRLAMSFPRTVGQLPIYYNMLPTDHAVGSNGRYVTGYVDCPLDPLYSFGEGLTYTDFAYGDILLDRQSLSDGEILKATVSVKNTGEREGAEVVQLYINDVYASISRPVKELKRFEKIHLLPGESKKVEFILTIDDFRFYDDNMDYVWEPGEIRIFIGPNSRCNNFKSVELK